MYYVLKAFVRMGGHVGQTPQMVCLYNTSDKAYRKPHVLAFSAPDNQKLVAVARIVRSNILWSDEALVSVPVEWNELVALKMPVLIDLDTKTGVAGVTLQLGG